MKSKDDKSEDGSDQERKSLKQLIATKMKYYLYI